MGSKSQIILPLEASTSWAGGREIAVLGFLRTRGLEDDFDDNETDNITESRIRSLKAYAKAQ
jgi:hypothetical protein